MRPDDWALVAPMVLVGTATATYGLIAALMPLLQRYALARPNARSSHSIPTPQGGGIAVVAAYVVATAASMALVPGHGVGIPIAAMLAACVVLGIVGAADDIVTLGALSRLAFQLAAATAVMVALPESVRIVDGLPLVLERGILVVSLVWFINLTNFMDGLDWITVAEVLPLCAGIAIFAGMGEVPPFAGFVALAIGGSMLGFAPYNRPVAKLFLGDVGSLPLGLALGWLLIVLASNGHLIAAVILPLYYLADATITLSLRARRGERIWEAHRTHFYQRATDNGYSVKQVVRDVFLTNLVLLGLAVAAVRSSSTIVDVVVLATSGAVVSVLLVRMVRR